MDRVLDDVLQEHFDGAGTEGINAADDFFGSVLKFCAEPGSVWVNVTCLSDVPPGNVFDVQSLREDFQRYFEPVRDELIPLCSESTRPGGLMEKRRTFWFFSGVRNSVPAPGAEEESG